MDLGTSKPAAASVAGDVIKDSGYRRLRQGCAGGLAQGSCPRRLLGPLVRSLQAVDADSGESGALAQRQGAARQGQHRRASCHRPAAARPVHSDRLCLQGRAATRRLHGRAVRVPGARLRRTSAWRRSRRRPRHRAPGSRHGAGVGRRADGSRDLCGRVAGRPREPGGPRRAWPSAISRPETLRAPSRHWRSCRPTSGTVRRLLVCAPRWTLPNAARAPAISAISGPRLRPIRPISRRASIWPWRWQPPETRTVLSASCSKSFRRDRNWNEQAARKQLVQLFEAWGPKDPATLDGRRRLSSLLFS